MTMKLPHFLLLLAPVFAEAPKTPFLSAVAELAARETGEDGTMTVIGRDGWLFFDRELAHLAKGEFRGEGSADDAAARSFGDPLPVILDFARQLGEHGIELLLVPIPPKALIYADKLPGSEAKPAPELAPHHQAFYALLRENGVRVLDPTALLISARADDEAQGPVFARTDTHFSGRGLRLIAEAIAAELPQLRLASPYRLEPFDLALEGDLLKDRPGSADPETLPLQRVLDADGNKPDPTPESPILLLGDSHTLVFHVGDDLFTRGAGLPEHLTHALGQPVDLLGVRGSGATPARISLFRRIQANPDYLKGKKAVVWVFTAREFTEGSGWRKIPLRR